jgi:superfamily II DNA or RNA helicase
MKIPTLHFHEGTLILKNWVSETNPPYFNWDSRNRLWRTLAIDYTKILNALEKANLNIQNQAEQFTSLDITLQLKFDPYEHQKEALKAWHNAGCRGSVVLPTGSGKSLVAHNAINDLKTSTLIVCPTIDLLNQWYDTMKDCFDTEVGILGAGYHEIHPLTVTTYDSAYRHIDQYGNKFGLLIFDEIHHLPAPTYKQIPELSIAPYRLGLTATYRRSDAQHLQLNHLIGPVVFEQKIKDMKGEILSDYEIHKIHIPLTEKEKAIYDKYSESYYKYVKEKQVRYFGNKWNDFIKESAYDPEARKALLARKEMRHLVFGAEKKMEALESILKLYHKDRIIIFTYDNTLVYTISGRYLVPAITHQTVTKERKSILDKFRKGEYRILVTSKVLNEGVDVPEANVAIILGGSASTTEHLQRLGRILRKKSGKKAYLYEIITGGTQETSVSYQRRGSDAYR